VRGPGLNGYSFGSASDRGGRFVERMPTVAATCRQQVRNVLDYLVAACEAPARVPYALPGFRPGRLGFGFGSPFEKGAQGRLPARLASSRAAVSSSTLRRKAATSPSRARTRGQSSQFERLIRLLTLLAGQVLYRQTPPPAEDGRR